ncbi:MAG: hypothetical protein J3R72DRAFT_430953 [Linnemannia gamsii]|nr:MAG: hypothetical protein J3R72DRAFT_430953 [Linnemannia gamsii]
MLLRVLLVLVVISWLVVWFGSFLLGELTKEYGECLLFVFGQERRECHGCERSNYELKTIFLRWRLLAMSKKGH